MPARAVHEPVCRGGSRATATQRSVVAGPPAESEPRSTAATNDKLTPWDEAR